MRDRRYFVETHLCKLYRLQCLILRSRVYYYWVCVLIRFEASIFIFHTSTLKFQLLVDNVIRLSLGKLLINLSQVVKRTNTPLIPSHMRAAVQRAVVARKKIFSKE